MSNYHLRDKELSLKAKGLLSVMLSLPDDWNYSASGLVSICKEGETAVKKAIAELKAKGYLIVTKKMANETLTGRIEYTYEIVEKPHVEKLKAEKQPLEILGLEKPHVEKLGLENQAQLNTNKSITKELNIKEIKERKKGNDDGVNFDSIIDSFEDEKIKEALRKFIKMRFANKKPLNNAIFQMLIDQLRKITSNESEQIDIINNSVMNGWNVFYSLDKNPNSLKVIRPTNDDDIHIEHEDVSDEELLELQRSLRGDD